MSETPRVSVVIPTYRRPESLLRAIESVLAQTFEDFELLVVDDASRDRTRAVVEGVRDARVRYVALPARQGPSQARNAGVELARSDWVAFLDDDDEWLAEYLAEQLARADSITNVHVDAVFSLVYRTRLRGRRKVCPDPSEAPSGGDIEGRALIRAVLTGGIAPTMSAWVVRRDVLVELGALDCSNPSMHDVDLWLRLAQAGHRAAVTGEPLVVWSNAGSDRVSADPEARERGLAQIVRRWEPLILETLGADEYERWLESRRGKAYRLHRRHIDDVMACGSRADAWRYARSMVRRLPWGARNVLRALGFALTGRRPRAKREEAGKVAAAPRD
ncbi:MAG: glycosyltransferase family 2 protein [Dehalococcoidia bacterium]